MENFKSKISGLEIKFFFLVTEHHTESRPPKNDHCSHNKFHTVGQPLNSQLIQWILELLPRFTITYGNSPE